MKSRRGVVTERTLRHACMSLYLFGAIEVLYELMMI